MFFKRKIIESLLTNKYIIEQYKKFEEYENSVDKNTEFLIELKIKIEENELDNKEKIIELNKYQDYTLYSFLSYILRYTNIDRYKYHEYCIESEREIVNYYDLLFKTNFILSYKNNKFNICKIFINMCNITTNITIPDSGYHNRLSLQKFYCKKFDQEFFLGYIKDEDSSLLVTVKNFNNFKHELNKKIYIEHVSLFREIFDEKNKNKRDLLSISNFELYLSEISDNIIIDTFAKQEYICKPIIKSWIDREISEEYRKYFYPNKVISIFDPNWISFDFEGDEWFKKER